MSGGRVVALGSSSVEPGSALVRELAALGWTVEARGVRGANARRLLGRVEPIDAGALVLVYLPHNGGSSAPDISALSREIGAAGATRVRWLLPPIFPERTPSDVRDAATRTRAAILAAGVPSVGSPSLGPADVGPDRVHLSAAGARFLARAWTTRLGRRTIGPWIALALALSFAWMR